MKYISDFSSTLLLLSVYIVPDALLLSVYQIDQQIEDMFASVKRVTDIAKPQVIANPTTGASALPTGQSNQQKLALAKQLAAKINMAKKIGPDARDITQQAAKFILSDEGFAPKVAVSFFVFCFILNV
jgi:hypothetical protein